MAMASAETPAAQFARLYSFYRQSYPGSAAALLSLCVSSGFEKCYGAGRIVCTLCQFAADCRLTASELETAHYRFSPACQVCRLISGPLENILTYLQEHLCNSIFSEQYYFEDEFLRQCSMDADFRQLTFAYGQWRSSCGLSVAEIANNGFYCSIKKHCIKCVACLRSLDNPQTVKNVEAWHATNSPACRFVHVAQTKTWEVLQYIHDLRGFLADDDVEVVGQPLLPSPSTSRMPFPSTSFTTTVGPRPIAVPKRSFKKAVLKTPSSLVNLFTALNNSGVSDGEARSAVETNPRLIQARTAAQFLQGMARPTPNLPSNHVMIETDLRAGQMATVTDSRCGLCINAEKDAVFLPCTHVYACYTCACRVRDADTMLQRCCCLCRQPVESVTQLRLTYNVTYH